MLTLVVPARADTQALQGWSNGANYSSTNATAGWQFTVDSDIIITHLGLWDSFADGLVESHKVTIWDKGGTALVIGTVQSQGSQAWHWTAVSPTILATGTYTIGGRYTSSGDRFRGHADQVLTALGIGYVRSVYASGDKWPTTNYPSDDEAYFGPNFRFAAPEPVPEPASVHLPVLLALACLGSWRRRRERAG
jgi:hypothetical protein